MSTLRIAHLGLFASLCLAGAPRGAAADPVHWPTNGHWYETRSTSYTRAAAEQFVQTLYWMDVQGHLATITSQAESDFLATWLPGAEFWIGGCQSPETSPAAQGWLWTTGETWDFTSWAPNEPNDFYGPGSESCLVLRSPSMGWNDAQDTEAKWLLVEYDGLVPVRPTTWGAIKARFERRAD